jgi:hypothetical protein
MAFFGEMKKFFSSLANSPHFAGIHQLGGSSAMRMTHPLRFACAFLFTALWLVSVASAQTETATVSGLITDETGAVVLGVEVKLQSVDRRTVATATTNDAGIYVFASVHPGQYQVTVHKPGFKQVDLLGMIVNVQDHIEQNFRLQIGSVAESVTVNANDLKINTTDASVSTVVDRQFAENLPLNGRSFQTLIQLAPGVVTATSNPLDGGQFSVNGQRADANYWMVDGVSANIGVSTSAAAAGNGFGGTLGSFSVLGGTNSLVSVDAMQEFRIQTSTYAPEFGRTPGAQISIATRSGTSQFHGTAFDYLRNDIFDANNWFNSSVTPPLPKAKERQNDFGGTFSGPIANDKNFFFFSYEGLRLRLPQTTLTKVPCDNTCKVSGNARAMATPIMQPFLNAFPLPSPNGKDYGNGTADADYSYSNPATLDAYSLRLDHKLGSKLTLFERYNYSPSNLATRGGSRPDALSEIDSSSITTQTATVGLTWIAAPTIANDLRFNFSRTNASGDARLDNFGGAVPLTSLPVPVPYTSKDTFFSFFPFSVSPLFIGTTGHNIQQQINLVDSVSLQRGSHSLRFGADFRRLSPSYKPQLYSQLNYFLDVPSAETGNLFEGVVESSRSATLLFRNLGVYAQDTWRILPRLTLTYGLRWDVDLVPQSLNGPSLPSVTGFDLNNLSNLALAPSGTAPYKTKYANFAPRLGLAYQLTSNQEWQTVLRGGFGVFYDLASSEIGNNINFSAHPFGASNLIFGPILGGTATFPLSSSDATPPPITPASLSSPLGELFAFEWNFALEQALGRHQTISASYVGAVGRRLLQTAFFLFTPNPNFTSAQLVANVGTSDYNALQVQFQRRLSRGFQALASYTFAHSIDTGSAGSIAVTSNALVPSAVIASNRGPSDFDIRHAFSVAFTYDVPAPKINAFTNAILRGWSLQNVIQGRSAPPVTVESYSYNGKFTNNVGGAFTLLRPNVVPGQPFYLHGSQYPGGKAFNPSAFTAPLDPTTGQFVQGNLGRNALRGFGAAQWDFAIHRDFPIHEQLKLQFRAEMFNVLNHPNFGPPNGIIAGSAHTFGLSYQMLNQSLNNGNLGGGGFDPLYQIGGPRSMQLALKLIF